MKNRRRYELIRKKFVTTDITEAEAAELEELQAWSLAEIRAAAVPRGPRAAEEGASAALRAGSPSLAQGADGP